MARVKVNKGKKRSASVTGKAVVQKSPSLQHQMPIGYTISQRAKLRDFEKRVLAAQKGVQ